MSQSSIDRPHPTPPVDRDPRDRPGVPMIPEPVPAEVVSLVLPQEPEVTVLVSVDVGELTPVFSTAVPPRGLSGLMRRRAYAIPEHLARRWLLLLLADRVDVWESRVRRHPWLTGGLAALAFALMAAGGRRR
ncbi:MAG TPA: hypothetical protein VN914_01810 [Polyangia bacterium]|nr:hypothetical protein [Polyangia bacterium]